MSPAAHRRGGSHDLLMSELGFQRRGRQMVTRLSQAIAAPGATGAVAS
jgi:hypothetical protein